MFFKSYTPGNILIVNTYGIGDCLFVTPMLRMLKDSFPTVRLSFLANKRVSELFRNHPDIEHVFVYERDDYERMYKQSPFLYWKEIKKSRDILKQHHFDVVFDCSMNTAMNFFLYGIGIPHRFGLNYRKRSRFLTYAKDIKGFEGQHVAQYYVDLLRELGVEGQAGSLELYISQEDREWVQAQFQNMDIDSKAFVLGVFPGGGASWGKGAHLKRWPKAKYRKLIEKCVEKNKCPIILMGDSQEEGICSEIASGLERVHNFSGKTSLGQLAALIEQCACLIVNDGGPLHMAVAVGTKTVSIFGPVDPVVYGPFSHEQNHQTVVKSLACQPCYRQFRMSNCTHISCLQNLDVTSIFEKVEKVL